MIPFIENMVNKVMTKLISFIKRTLVLATFFAFVLLFSLYFYFMHTGKPLYCIVCLAGIYTFIHLNKSM